MLNKKFKYGIISAPQPEAVEVGLEIFEKGGNVVDVAIATALIQTVVDPQMCGIAGFGSLQMYLNDKRGHQAIDFYGRAPLSVKEDMWLDLIKKECDDGFGFVLEGRVNEFGYQCMTTPMTLKAFDFALKKYGNFTLSQLLDPAIKYCNEGFSIRPKVHAFWMQPAQAGRMARVSVVNHFPEAKKIYLDKDGNLLKVGDLLKNPDMGKTYKKIAEEGIEVFYEGSIANKICQDMKKNGGLITKDDLQSCEIEENSPLEGIYKGFDIFTNRPPGGGIMLIQMLNILENFDLASLGHNSAKYISVVSEAMKYATIDKDKKVGDPKFIDVPVEELISKKYAKKLSDLIKSGEKANVARFDSSSIESKDTTHVSVVDTKGNAVSLTHSLGSSSGVITEGLGFMYNNCMMVFDPRPGNVGSLAPGKTRFTSMCPTIIKNADKLKLIVGAPGGTTITMGVLQTILNVLDFGMSASDAVSAPRFITTSNTIELTNRILRKTEKSLQNLGYPTVRYAVSYATPLVHAIRVSNGDLDAGADPAGDGLALGI